MEFSFREIWELQADKYWENGINLWSIIFFTVFIIAVSFVLKFLKTGLPFTETGRIQKVYHLQSDKIFHLRPFFYPWDEHDWH